MGIPIPPSHFFLLAAQHVDRYAGLPTPTLSRCLSNKIEKVGFPSIQGYTVFRQLLPATWTYGSTVGSMRGRFNCIQVYTGDTANLGLIMRFPFICKARAQGYNQEHFAVFHVIFLSQQRELSP